VKPDGDSDRAASREDSNGPAEPRIDRTAITIAESFAEAEAQDAAYWRSRTPQQCIDYMEQLRHIIHGSATATQRIQRVLEIAERQ
jgi:hypothetical protein